MRITKQYTNRESQSLDRYLQEIGKVELLTPDMEIELAKRIKRGGAEGERALEQLVKEVQPDQPDQLVKVDQLEQQVQLEAKDRPVQLVQLVNKDQLDQLELKVKWEQVDSSCLLQQII